MDATMRLFDLPARQDLITYYESGIFESNIENLLQGLNDYVLQQIALAKSLNQKIAVVFDIDETCLSNYLSFKAVNFDNSPNRLLDRYRQAIATAIKPVLRFYEFLKNQNVEIFFISFRPETVRTETLANLSKCGYSVDVDHLYLPTPEQEQSLSTDTYKTSIREMIETQLGYHIILNIGDQISDLVGGHAQKTIKLPNELYNCAIKTLNALAPSASP